MSTSKTSNDSLSMTALLHSLKIQLSSTNFLLWRSQIWPLLSDLDLIGHVDGIATAPPEVLTTDGKTPANPQYTAWMAADRHAVILINSSLSEEAVSVTVGLTTARAIWQALTNEYCNASVERVHNIRDKLRSLVKGSDSVAEFGRKFKGLCDQLSAIGHAVSDSDKLHWFTAGLGVDYISFTSIVRASRPSPSFQDLVAQAESHEVLVRELQSYNSSSMAFVAQSSRPPRRGGRGDNRGYRNYRGGRNNRTPMVLVIRVNCVASMVMSLVRVLPMCRIPPVKPILQTRFRRNVKLIPTMLVGMLTPGLPIIRLNLLDRETRQVLAQGRCENGLYVLNQDHQALSAVSINKASYELWHSRLGHVSNDVIKLLNKTGLVQVTSILPKPIVCSSCQMSKAQKLPFDLNPKRALFPLDLVHCDLWRPSPITSHEGYRYYVAFVDDFSRT
uniref:Putative GAG-pre-integrase domain-containing protein n=1 Tax=Helianthus annuus TaxID=4232 RepID=A0A251SD45_HELAN